MLRVLASEIDPCQRQAFRAICPPEANGKEVRSQFVLRYYRRQNECVSYPYGHCRKNNEEPELYKYKDECEQNCFGSTKRVDAGPLSPPEASTVITHSELLRTFPIPTKPVTRLPQKLLETVLTEGVTEPVTVGLPLKHTESRTEVERVTTMQQVSNITERPKSSKQRYNLCFGKFALNFASVILFFFVKFHF